PASNAATHAGLIGPADRIRIVGVGAAAWVGGAARAILPILLDRSVAVIVPGEAAADAAGAGGLKVGARVGPLCDGDVGGIVAAIAVTRGVANWSRRQRAETDGRPGPVAVAVDIDVESVACVGPTLRRGHALLRVPEQTTATGAGVGRVARRVACG